MADDAAAGPARDGAPEPDTVASVANLYLGNLLYAIERTALSLEEEGKPMDAAWYRGLGRKLAEARGRERPAG